MSDAGTPFEHEFDEAAAFPGPGDKLFPGTRRIRHASPSRSTLQDWYDYTTGYKEAADILVTYVEATGQRRQDKLCYPILFLYRQHLELVVKRLIRECYDVLAREADFPKHHYLDRLWRLCASLLLEISPTTSQIELSETTRLFDELCGVDPTSDAFRYPEHTDSNALFGHGGDVNLGVVRDVANKISFFLDCIDTSLRTERDSFYRDR